MEIKVLTTVTVDIPKERERLEKAFDDAPEAKNRQIEIVDAFERREFNKVLELINALPYNGKDECPEQEYVSLAIHDFLSFVLYSKYGAEIVP